MPKNKSHGIKPTNDNAARVIATTATYLQQENTMTKTTTASVPAYTKQARVMPERMLTQHTSALLARYRGTALMRTFDHAVNMRRPHGGAGERNMLGYLLLNLPQTILDGTQWSFDTVGNLHVDARGGSGSRTLFVGHVDAVHLDDGRNHPQYGTTVVRAGPGAALGADDGAGLAILMHLLTHNVPGYYMFVVGEECGGIGSSHVAASNKDLLAQFDRAIAFDRRGTSDIITHQSAGRCASDVFAEALSEALNNEGMMYMPCDGGVYTDTAEFVDIIPECTNVSVGYLFEHSDDESQDLVHLCELADAVLAVHWESLPTARDPSVREYIEYGGYGGVVTGMQDEDEAFDAEAVALLEALEQVIDSKSTTLLERMMVGVVHPEDMALSYTAVRRALARMTEDMAYIYIDMVGQFPVDAIIQDLFDETNALTGA